MDEYLKRKEPTPDQSPPITNPVDEPTTSGVQKKAKTEGCTVTGICHLVFPLLGIRLHRVRYA